MYVNFGVVFFLLLLINIPIFHWLLRINSTVQVSCDFVHCISICADFYNQSKTVLVAIDVSTCPHHLPFTEICQCVDIMSSVKSPKVYEVSGISLLRLSDLMFRKNHIDRSGIFSSG